MLKVNIVLLPTETKLITGHLCIVFSLFCLFKLQQTCERVCLFVWCKFAWKYARHLQQR